MPPARTGHTVHVPSGTVAPIFDVAERYRNETRSTVLVAGERYGTGSSRDWAAKGQRWPGIRAVRAMSCEHIHRSNLIGMDILPLRLPSDRHAAALRIEPGDRFEIDAPPDASRPRSNAAVSLVRGNRSVERFLVVTAIGAKLEIGLLRVGGVMPYILKNTVARQAIERYIIKINKP